LEPLKVSEILEQCRGTGQPDDELTGLYETQTDALARKHTYQCPTAQIPPSSTAQKKKDDQSLFRDPTMWPSVDFQSDHGFKQAAKKKKGGNKQQQQQQPPPPPPPPVEEKKDEAKKEEQGGGNGADKSGGDKAGGDKSGGDKSGGDKAGGDKSGGDKAGDSGNGAGKGAGKGDDDKDKKDKKDKKDEDAGKDQTPVDDFETFLAPKTKKKGKKGKVEEPIPEPTPEPPVKENSDAFTDIKLDDIGAGLDLNFSTEAPPAKASTGGGLLGGFGSWGSSWSTGGST